MCDKLCVELYNVLIIYLFMFPYNDDDNAWISKSSISKTQVSKDSFIFSILFAFTAALFMTTTPLLIYFFRINLF